jgi:hypothetical protein
MDKFKHSKTLPYYGWVREQLAITKVKVRKWVEWNPESDQYEAFYDNRSVVIPIPVDEWSFLVCLHEIGHLSSGDRIYSYLREYNAEQWAINRAKQAYNIENLDYELDAKWYVTSHLLQDLFYSELTFEKIKPHVLSWLGHDKDSLKKLYDTTTEYWY